MLRYALAVQSLAAIACGNRVRRCREEGRSQAILFNLCGHGHFDMQAYIDYFGGKLQDLDYDEAELAMALAGLPSVKAA